MVFTEEQVDVIQLHSYLNSLDVALKSACRAKTLGKDNDSMINLLQDLQVMANRQLKAMEDE